MRKRLRSVLRNVFEEKKIDYESVLGKTELLGLKLAFEMNKSCV